MITKIHEGKKENGSTYWQGLLFINKGRLQGVWITVTKRCDSELEASLELDDFKSSVADVTVVTYE